MAKIYNPPAELGPVPRITHPFDSNAYNEACAKYEQAIKDWAKKNGKGNLKGEQIRFQVADGYAVYIVLSSTQLIHVPIGDAWSYQYAYRLTGKDIQAEVERARAFERIFARKRFNGL